MTRIYLVCSMLFLKRWALDWQPGAPKLPPELFTLSLSGDRSCLAASSLGDQLCRTLLTLRRPISNV